MCFQSCYVFLFCYLSYYFTALVSVVNLKNGFGGVCRTACKYGLWSADQTVNSPYCLPSADALPVTWTNQNGRVIGGYTVLVHWSRNMVHAGLVVQEVCESYAAILNTFKGFRFSLVEELLSFGISFKYSQKLQQVSISRF